jgi:CDP-diacylglycerol--serine O-phosphatidyltransferase
MIREFHLAESFTLANAGCGVASMFAADASCRRTIRQFFSGGRCCRWRWCSTCSTGASRAGGSGTRRWGASWTSLADVISFGVAPAALAFAAGMRGGLGPGGADLLRRLRGQPLARYNVTAEELARARTR